MKFILFLFLLIFNQNIFAAASIHYDTLPIGERGFLQGGAFIARSDDASASWYNPAGLVMHEVDSVSASGSIFALASSERSDGNTFNDFITIPSFVGSIGHIYPNLVWSFSIVSPANATSEVNSYSTGNYTSDGLEYKDMKVFDRSSFTQNTLAPGISLAASLSSDLRLGAGVRIFNTGFKTEVQQKYINSGSGEADSTYNKTLEYILSAEAYNLRLEFGAQYDFNENISFGLFVRTLDLSLSSPAVSFNASTSTSGEGMTTMSALVIGRDGIFNYKYPTSLMFGASWTSKMFDFEACIKYYSSIDSFNMVEGLVGERTMFRTDSNGDTTGDSSLEPYLLSEKESDSVLNFALGGSYKWSEKILLQAGFYTDGDPNQINDNLGFTLGTTVFNKNSSSSIGFIYVVGSGKETVNQDPFSDSMTPVVTSNSIIGINMSGSVYF